MEEKTIVEKFTALAEGSLTTEEWKDWFDDHAKAIEIICGRTCYLKIRPSQNCSDLRNIYQAQTAAFNWLKSKQINVILSDTYQKKYQKEFDDYCKKEDEKRKQSRKIVDRQFGYMKDVYPVLLRQLKKSYNEDFHLEKGKDIEHIDRKEHELSLKMSGELKAFFSHISGLQFEGIRINFDDLERYTVDGEDFLILGEFWCYGDGDKLLYHISNGHISVLAHEYRPVKIINQAATMKEFVETIFVQYLKQYED